MSDPGMVIPALGMAAIVIGLMLSTLVTRTSFLVAGDKLKLGQRAQVALRYAPVCTLSAIIVPDVLFHGGDALDLDVFNPRLVGACAAALWLLWSRNIVGCLATGMLAYTVARIFL